MLSQMTNMTSDIEYELPRGFRWAAAASGIRKPGRPDVGLIAADKPCPAAATFTQNAFCAAPVILSRELLSKTEGFARGVVVNSGCANAATGDEGMANARAMSALAALETGWGGEDAPGAFLVCSTGTIGVQLPMDKLGKGISEAASRLGAARESFDQFSRSILTTDTRQKIAWAQFKVNDATVRIIACAKGSGMIYPRMATLLAFTATDAAIEPAALQSMFSRTVEKSLNCLTVDGDTSTNDTAVILASGASGVEIVPGSDAASLFEAHLLDVLQQLAMMLAADGEGATKLIEVHIASAGGFEAARRVALAIANSNLVKTAIYGKDANWGRICCAIGNSGVAVDPARVTVWLGPIKLFEAGAPAPFDEEAALKILSERTVRIRADLGIASGEATVWTCDFTEKYIEINGAYRT